MEIQQSNKIATASKEIEISNSYAAINESIYSNPAVGALLAKVSSPDAELTPAEEQQIVAFCYRLHNVWSALETADAYQLLPSDSFGTIEDNLRMTLREYPRTAPYFRAMLEDYPSKDENRVHQIIRQVLEEKEF